MLETPARIEPAFFEDETPNILASLASEIQSAVVDLGAGLHPHASAELADFVRMMNCYYSNLIEGHNTRPKDIESAVQGAELDPERRPLALEAKAHVTVQREIDLAYADGTLASPVSREFLSWVHREFYQNMPEEFRTAKAPGGRSVPIVPGAFRASGEEDVEVGQHTPPSSERVQDFLAHFEKRYAQAEKWANTRIIAIAAAHHRLNFIHPFVDGNGRVSRLMSHAMGLRAGIGANGLWSISRGLARGLKERGEYKSMLDHADMPRQGDRDGRGNLSRRALVDFCEWFLSVMLDQIRFTKAAFALPTIEQRYGNLLKNLGHNERSVELIAATLKFGKLNRGEAMFVLKTSERTARDAVSKLVEEGFLRSTTPKGPVRVSFPVQYRESLFPNLFTDVAFEPPAPPRLQRDRLPEDDEPEAPAPKPRVR